MAEGGTLGVPPGRCRCGEASSGPSAIVKAGTGHHLPSTALQVQNHSRENRS